MQFFDTAIHDINRIHDALSARSSGPDTEFDAVAASIIADVRERGLDAVIEYTHRFDSADVTAATCEIPEAEWSAALNALDPSLRTVFTRSAENIRSFHMSELERLQSWEHSTRSATGSGTVSLGQRISPVKRAGIYVPGGKAFYPSTVLMAAIPAVVAGVSEVVLCTPANSDGSINPVILAALKIAGVHRAFKIGGAQAIAAMAFGAGPIPKVDVIAGPGNAYVNSAKKLVYGTVGIDMLAGPSEVAIIADESADLNFVAADLLAQIEHGPGNRGILFSDSEEFLQDCADVVRDQMTLLSRQQILEGTHKNLVFVRAETLDECVVLANVLAPEHLELCVAEPRALLPSIENAGAILLGHFTSAPIGDYIAGPSHTLPTAGTARFSSPLSVNTFVKRSSVIEYSAQAAQDVASDAILFAQAEGFDAHANAAKLRSEN